MNFLEKIKAFFNNELKFDVSAKLADSGKDIRIVGDLTEGSNVFIITKDAELPIPDEIWKLDNGFTITTKDGVIVSVEETEDTPQEPIQNEVAEEQATEMAEPDAPTADDSGDSNTPEPEEPTTENSIEEKIGEMEQKIETLTMKIDELVAALGGVMGNFEKVEAEIQKTKDEINTRFEKVSTVPTLKVKDKEIIVRKEGSMLGSWEELRKK